MKKNDEDWFSKFFISCGNLFKVFAWMDGFGRLWAAVKTLHNIPQSVFNNKSTIKN